MTAHSISGAQPIIVSLAFWLDLRGYGAMLNEAKFDPTRTSAKAAIERLRRFHEVVATYSRTTFPTLVINDGAVVYRDVGLTVTDRVLPFVDRCWHLYQAAQKADVELGGIGLRGVLAAGLRARGSNRGILAQNEGVAKIIGDFAQGRITFEEAIKLAGRVRRTHDIVPQLQANFAFTRAYIAEQGARTGKLEGSRFYLETSIFRNGIPDWMTAGPSIQWMPNAEWLSNLAADFVEIRQIIDAPNREVAMNTGREILSDLQR